MASTQDHLPISTIQQDLVILKDGSMAVVLETSAVNFGLLSENEQLAIISSFAGLLNSLSFMIQIVIRSKRLDISSYLHKLEEAKRVQTNPLLVKMIESYTQFVKNTIQENEVLDKQFFIVVPVSYLELGIGKSGADSFKKALTILFPRRDHIIRQLSRIGLKATQLDSEHLIKLFYDIYNEPDLLSTLSKEQPLERSAPIPTPQVTSSEVIAPSIPIIPSPTHPVIDRPIPPTPQRAPAPVRGNRPFVVEELSDEYGSV